MRPRSLPNVVNPPSAYIYDGRRTNFEAPSESRCTREAPLAPVRNTATDPKKDFYLLISHHNHNSQGGIMPVCGDIMPVCGASCKCGGNHASVGGIMQVWEASCHSGGTCQYFARGPGLALGCPDGNPL
ncbi:hypothetical protein AVEN_273938-1 [Araneus ventricosus]|uniref:Uncharacterized protein n=1 Tax=Araneus ventricosus TaxID=182803 RepID=A0A4Y2Q662_ARAVE|nr:hypothetical protein AVEN_273938-1 [Araneus ventricosus]